MFKSTTVHVAGRLKFVNEFSQYSFLYVAIGHIIKRF